MDEKISMNTFRKSLGVKLDYFNEFKFDESKEEDHMLMYYMTNTIRDLSKICFQ